MNKFLLLLIVATVFIPSLQAKESNLAILQAVYSNGVQKFSIAQNEFLCKTYGVLTLDELYKKAKENSMCQKSIKQFYTKNPISLVFTKRLLKQKQQYKIEFRENRCIIYARGQATLSEILLKNGLAVLKPKFNDKEFRYLLANTQNYAQKLEIGMFKNKITSMCISELYK